MSEAIPDGLVLHAGDPEPKKGLAASGLMIDQPENEFSLSSGIRCADEALHILTLHELLQNAELLLGGRRHLILPSGGQDGKIGKVPFGIGFVVAFRRRQFHQMADTPADDVAVALQISIAAFVCAQHLGQDWATEGFSARTSFIAGSSLHRITPPVRWGREGYVKSIMRIINYY